MLIATFVILGVFGAIGVTLAEVRDRPARRAERHANLAQSPAE